MDSYAGVSRGAATGPVRRINQGPPPSVVVVVVVGGGQAHIFNGTLPMSCLSSRSAAEGGGAGTAADLLPPQLRLALAFSRNGEVRESPGGTRRRSGGWGRFRAAGSLVRRGGSPSLAREFPPLVAASG